MNRSPASSPPDAGRISAEPAALTRYACAQRAAGEQVAAHATGQRGEIGALTMTFGIIGADFLAATAYVLDRRAHALDTIANRHRAQGTATTSARTAYTATDRTGGRSIAASECDSRELRL